MIPAVLLSESRGIDGVWYQAFIPLERLSSELQECDVECEPRTSFTEHETVKYSWRELASLLVDFPISKIQIQKIINCVPDNTDLIRV